MAALIRILAICSLFVPVAQVPLLYACPGYGPITLPQAVTSRELPLKNLTTEEFINSRLGGRIWIQDKQNLIEVANPFTEKGFLVPESYGTIRLRLKLNRYSPGMGIKTLSVFAERPLLVDRSFIPAAGVDKYIMHDELVTFSFDSEKPVSELSFSVPDIYSPARFLFVAGYENNKSKDSDYVVSYSPNIRMYCSEQRRLVESLQVATSNCEKLRNQSWSKGVDVNRIISSCKEKIKLEK